jgi:hypothetical protein
MQCNKKAIFALGRLKVGERNKTESDYEKVLITRQSCGEIVKYWFESWKFRLADNTFYTPDFVILMPDGELIAHEVKGFMMDDANVKIKVAAELFPMPFYVVRKQAKKLGGGWSIILV